MMNKAGVNCLRIGEFAWKLFEPFEGLYDFEWLDKFLLIAGNNGIKVLLCAPVRTAPNWLVKKDSDVLITLDTGQKLSFGSRYTFCINNPYLLDRAGLLAEAMSAHYADHPAIIGWNTGRVKGNQAQFKSFKKPLTLEDMEVAKHRNWQKYSQYERDNENAPSPPGSILRPGYPRYTHYGIDENPFRDRDVIGEAVDGILSGKKSESGNPWIQYVGLLGPHDPYKVPQEYLDKIDPDAIELPSSFGDAMKDKPGFYRRIGNIYSRLAEEKHRQALHHYFAFCAFIDDQFGRVLNALKQSKQEQNTLVLFVSDHGDYAAEHGLWTKGLAPFRGAYHVPAVMRWPAGIANPGRVIDELISLVDFAPTFLEAANCKKKNPHGKVPTEEGGSEQIPLSGRSLIPFLKKEPVTWRKELFAQSNGNELYGIQRIVFDKNYKFVFNGFDYDELYNLKADPGETKNLIAEGIHGEFESIVKEYYKKIWLFARRNGDQYNNSYINRAYPSFGPGIIFEKKNQKNNS